MSPITESNIEEAEKAFGEMENAMLATSTSEIEIDKNKKQNDKDLIEFDETIKERKDSIVGDELGVLISMDLAFDMDNNFSED